MRQFVESRANPGRARRRAEQEEKGQVIVEYLLMIVVSLAIVTIIATGFRKSLFKLWRNLDREIAAPCPKCPPPPGMN